MEFVEAKKAARGMAMETFGLLEQARGLDYRVGTKWGREQGIGSSCPRTPRGRKARKGRGRRAATAFEID